MLQFGTGSSNDKDPKSAGKMAAQKAKGAVADPKVAFVYASCDYDLKAMIEGIKAEMPGVPLIGNTSFTGVITGDGFCTGDGFVGVMAMGGDDVTVGVAAMERGADARATGHKVAQAAMQAAGKKTQVPDCFYMSAPPAEEEFFLKGITEVIGRVPIFGGSAADNSISGDWMLYTDDSLFADGVNVAFIYLKNGDMTNLYTGAYRETDDVGIITKVKDNRVLQEIDGVPALKKYAEWAGVDVESLKGDALLAATITSPLGVKNRLGDLIAIRHPMNGNDDYSMDVGSNLAEKTAVIRMEGSIDDLIQSVPDTLKQLKAKLPGRPKGYHLVHCGGRRAGIDDRIEEMSKVLLEAVEGVPFIMEFTFGEYGFEDDGNNTMGGLMLSFTAFSE